MEPARKSSSNNEMSVMEALILLGMSLWTGLLYLQLTLQGVNWNILIRKLLLSYRDEVVKGVCVCVCMGGVNQGKKR